MTEEASLYGNRNFAHFYGALSLIVNVLMNSKLDSSENSAMFHRTHH
jgi:hypothetical protein